MKSTIELNKYLSTVIFLFIVLAHLGVDELISFQFISFLFSLIFFWRYLLDKLYYLTCIGVVYFAVLVIAFYIDDHETNTLLRGCRSALVASLLFTIAHSIGCRVNNLFVNFYFAIYGVCVFSLGLAFLQLIDSALWNRGYFDVPATWYSLEYGTLLSESRDSLYGAGYFIRPSALFSEPSALVALGIVGLYCASAGDSIIKLPFFKQISFALLVVPLSINGFLLLPWAIFIYSDRKHVKKIVMYYLFVILLMMASYALNDNLKIRINSIFDGSDISASIRIFEPIDVIFKIFSNGFIFGVSQEVALSYASSEVYSVFNNWLFNQIILYGIFGILFITIPFCLLGNKIHFVIFSFMILNGELFYYDRFFLILCGVVAAEYFKNFRGGYKLDEMYR